MKCRECRRTVQVSDMAEFLRERPRRSEFRCGCGRRVERAVVAAAIGEMLTDPATAPSSSVQRCYRRRLTVSMARWLAALVAEGGGSWVHTGDVARRLSDAGEHAAARGGDGAKVRFWKLAEPDPERPGFWRPTTRGIRWTRGEVAVNEYAEVVSGQAIALTGAQITFDDVIRRDQSSPDHEALTR